MKNLITCKVFAVIFIIGIIASLCHMRTDLQRISEEISHQHSISQTADLGTFDRVYIYPERAFGVIEQPTNGEYYVVYVNSKHETFHATFAKTNLAKVICFRNNTGEYEFIH
jgi:hypothetical protein